MDSLNKLDQRYGELHKAKELFERLSTSYSRFVPREFLQLLRRNSVLDIQLGDSVEVEVTIMFSDIRSFTRLSESMSPRENFLFLNSYLRRISPIIRANGGFIDKYIGDGVMAIFSRSPKDAILAAVSMIEAMRLYNEHRESSGYVPIKIGIGLNTGKVILGTIGNPEQMDGTVISNCVNVAARLEQLTKQFGCSILVTEHTLQASGLKGSISSRHMGKVAVRGKQEMVDVHEIYQGSLLEQRQTHDQTKPALEAGVHLLSRANFAGARLEFEKVLQINPDDQAAKYFIGLVEEQEKGAGAPLRKAG